VHAGTRLTFAAWDRAADGLATHWLEAGVEPGDVIALMLPSSIDYAICYQAAMRLRAITTGINTRLGPQEIASILDRTAPRVIVRETDLTALRETYTLEAWGLPVPQPRDPVAIVWTSGTTGMPKGAVFDHENLAAVAVGAGELGREFDHRLSPLPFAHVAYMSRPWEEIEKVITTIIPTTPWTASETLELIASERVTVGQGVPTQWRLVLDHPSFASTDVSSLRIAGTGAASVPPELVREMEAKLCCPVVIGYTSTEAAITTGTVPGDAPEVIARTVGRARVNVELEVVDDDGKPCPIGVVGRVRCRSGAAMRGYWHDRERTDEVIDGERWLTTGDMGSLDERGYLTLAGRRSEMYIRGGYNIYPVEVEHVLSSHPDVAQVAIVGVPDHVLGEIGIAFVVAAAGARPDLEELRAHVRTVLADYKAPDRLEAVDTLPLTSIGKVDKRALIAGL
jgi:acyl-CoA synthetase (AMP-forming)/AMP-acid ligase II